MGGSTTPLPLTLLQVSESLSSSLLHSSTYSQMVGSRLDWGFEQQLLLCSSTRWKCLGSGKGYGQ